MKVKPLDDRLLVERLEAEERTPSGIYLPDTAKETPQQAKVIEVGTGKVNEKTGDRQPLQVNKGDKVLLSKWGGTEVTVNGDEYVIVSEDDVLAVVDE